MNKLYILLLLLAYGLCGNAQLFVQGRPSPGAFPIASAAIYIDSNDDWLVRKSAELLREDIFRVTGRRPDIVHRLAPKLIILGTIEKCPLLSGVAPDTLRGKWDAFSIAVRKVQGVGQALVIAGSNNRGAAYGALEISRSIGVSPWYWWADVPPRHRTGLYVPAGSHLFDSPAVRYRGIFINDEAPCLSGWTKEKFGGFNHLFYEKVFELLLRMKGNYLWPAMWGNAFNDDDKLNPALAHRYGIVMGTSHHEPMLRAQQEWKRYGSGEWNYDHNAAKLDSFWRQGIVHMGDHASIVTVGMRGDGDMPMTEGSNIALLEKIVTRQRQILAEVTGKPAEATPQSWALYKEVQDYYDKDMRVPDDITLLLCDDNWGNLRKLPAPSDPPRAGGYGIYYHFDYVGDPRNYKWINTNSIPRVWEQMHLAFEHGVDRIWIVNVGDIKPLELPIEFFLDYAWQPDRIPACNLPAWMRKWAKSQFGPKHASVIADILEKYTRFNARRKPELLEPDTYSISNYNEAQRVVDEYNAVARRADSIYRLLPASMRDAYYQLVLHPVIASANLNELYVTVARSRLYASQGRPSAQALADRARALYLRDSMITKYYNDTLAHGKWRHLMDQTHIGYTYWQQPPFNTMPALPSTTHPRPWGAIGDLHFDRYSNDTPFIDLFNGKLSYDASWLHTRTRTVNPGETRVFFTVDWKKAPVGVYQLHVRISGPDHQQKNILASIDNRPIPCSNTFVEADHYVSIEAEHFTRKSETEIKWLRIPGLGRTRSGMTTIPVTAASLLTATMSQSRPTSPPSAASQLSSTSVQTTKLTRLDATTPYLEYNLYLRDSGAVTVHAFCSPTLNFNSNGLRYAISFDNEPPQIIDLSKKSIGEQWLISVANNIFISTSNHVLLRPGKHVLRYGRVDPGVVLQKLVVDTGGLKPSYLGPPESRFKAD